MPVADVIGMRHFDRQLRRVNRDPGFDDILDQGQHALVPCKAAGHFRAQAQLHDPSPVAPGLSLRLLNPVDLPVDLRQFRQRKNIGHDEVPLLVIDRQLIGTELAIRHLSLLQKQFDHGNGHRGFLHGQFQGQGVSAEVAVARVPGAGSHF